ncbi:hypothetical protein F2P79_005998 [Pimephales promelas]|nr:hypothetical protein F2P79_005998 [Pimephales promelas]
MNEGLTGLSDNSCVIPEEESVQLCLILEEEPAQPVVEHKKPLVKQYVKGKVDISSSLRTLSHSCPPQSHCQIFLHVSVMANSTAQAFTATSAESNFDTSSLIPVHQSGPYFEAIVGEAIRVSKISAGF